MKLHYDRGCEAGASEGEISSHGSLYVLLKNGTREGFRVLPLHHPTHGLVWQAKEDDTGPEECWFKFDRPDLLIQEMLAADWKKKHRKRRRKK